MTNSYTQSARNRALSDITTSFGSLRLSTENQLTVKMSCDSRDSKTTMRSADKAAEFETFSGRGVIAYFRDLQQALEADLETVKALIKKAEEVCNKHPVTHPSDPDA